MKKINFLKSLFALLILSNVCFASGVVLDTPTNQTSQSIAGKKTNGEAVSIKATDEGFLSVSQSPLSVTVRSMDAFSTVGVGVPVNVSGAEDIYAVVSCSTSGCDKQIRFQAAFREDPLLEQNDFLGSSGTLEDPWTYISFYDIVNPSSVINGSTGYNHTGQSVRVFLLNVDGAVQITPRVVTNSVAGNVTVDITYFSGN